MSSVPAPDTAAAGVGGKKKKDPLTKTKKPTKTVPKSVLDKIVYAIRELKDCSEKGSSRSSIVKFLKDVLEYDNPTATKKALKLGCTKNILQQQGQSFRVVGDPVYEDTSINKLPKLVIEDLSTSKKKKKKKTTGTDDDQDSEATTTTAQHGDMVTMSYRGTLTDADGYEFDKASKFEFMLGVGDVIKGWDQGIVGMSVGEKRRLVVPPHLGYGKRGCSPDIPPNSTLHFVVQLKKITRS